MQPEPWGEMVWCILVSVDTSENLLRICSMLQTTRGLCIYHPHPAAGKQQITKQLCDQLFELLN